MKYVGYLRVSTARQGQSGLGLESQRAAIESFLSQGKGVLLETFVEVESGSVNARPQLQQALHLAKVTGATLIIAKLDRLSRNAAFLLSLQDSGARFVAVDMPDANELTVGIMALVAQQERQAISKRTKDALAAAKARGQVLGNPNGAAPFRKAGKGNGSAVAASKAIADAHAGQLGGIVKQLQESGHTSLGAIAAALNKKGVLTPRRGRWHRSSVSNLIKRLGTS